MSRHTTYVILFLVTASTLVLELSMTRLFSVVMYYHFAFLAISLALFGLGASGQYLYLSKRGFGSDDTPRALSTIALLFAVSIIVALFVSLSQAISMEYSTANVFKLGLIYVFSLIPFFFSGLIVSLILFQGARDISRLYFWDLAGAATGALVTVPILNAVGAINAQLVAAVLSCVAAVIASTIAKGRQAIASYVIAILVSGLLLVNFYSPIFEVRYTKGMEKQNVELQKWNSFSFITVQGIPGEPTAKVMDIDADARTYIIQDPFALYGADVIKSEIAKTMVSHVPNILLDDAEVLIIGPGGGIDVVFALAWGAKSIDAVEINPIIVDDVMLDKYRAYSGNLYARPDVHVHKSEGRSFVARSEKLYDMVQLTLVDTWAATSAGAFSLSENNLYTVEAFTDYIERLKPDGVVAVTRWLSAKPKEGLRLMAIAMEAARQMGIANPHQHIAIVGSSAVPAVEQEMMTLIFKKSPLEQQEIAQIGERVALMNGRMVFSPEMRATNEFTQFAYAPDVNKFYEQYEFNITPSTDDQPFFFHALKGANLAKIMTLDLESRKNNIGLFNLYVAAVLSLLLVLAFLIGPLVLSKTGRLMLGDWTAIRPLTYFVFIGLGFIMIEIALMQKLILFLGHPVYALAVVLTVILISAGTGSYLTRNHDHQTSRRYGRFLFPAIIATVLIVTFSLPLLIEAAFGLTLFWRIAIAALLLAPIGVLLGQPFPIELKAVEHHRREIIPWVWSLNGAASVLGSVAAVALAMAYGFTAVVLIGTGCYLMAFLVRGKGTDAGV